MSASVFVWDKVEAQQGIDEVDFYYHNDHLATPMFMTDAAGDIVWTISADPFNQYAVNEDPDGDGIGVHNPFRFPGQYSDSETNDLLWYNWNRYYIPSLGRYNQPDPIDFPGNNSYAYANNNPNIWLDPSGAWIETGLDVAGLLWDLYDFHKAYSCGDWKGMLLSGGSAVLDIGGILLPIVPAPGVVTHIDDVGKLALKADDLAKLALKADDPLELHHLLPRQFEDFFENAGLKIKDHTLYLTKSMHREAGTGIHAGPYWDSWNGRWELFKNSNPYAGPKQILDHLDELRKHFKI